MCGGTKRKSAALTVEKGLSPRVRRHHDSTVRCGYSPGSISACAEAPSRSLFPLPPQRVYLRVCGGTRDAGGNSQPTRGLSPRVRRHHRHEPPVLDAERSISACAEAPHRRRRVRRAAKVYLRVCGGTFFWSTLPFTIKGLSPRVRRHHGDMKKRQWKKRSISACAEAPTTVSQRICGARVYLRVCGGTPSP